MAARSTRGPGGRGGRRPMSTGRGRRGSSSSGCAMVAVPIAAVLVLGVSLLCTPAMFYADLVAATVALAGTGLFIAVSLLLTRRTYSPSGAAPAEGAGASRTGSDGGAA